MRHKKKNKRGYRGGPEMYAHIRAWEAGGQSQKSYMAEQGLSKSVFGYWLRRYRQDQQFKVGSFVAVTAPTQEQPPSQGFACLRLSNGSELILHEAVSAAYLRELLGW